jgi:predicted patatin/cPLA2 family phospholipase
MRALVISGGGSKGAFAGGVAEYLLTEKSVEYDIFIGSSTGSLLIPLLALGEVDKIKKLFTSVKQGDIFSVNPIGLSILEEKFKLKYTYLTLIWRIFFERPTFGESKNLRKLIRNNLTREQYKRLQKSGKEAIITVSNLTQEKVEYKSSNECEWEDFCDWIWASANVVPFMSLLHKNGCYYADGGFGDNIPISEAVRKGAKTIDVIVLEIKEREAMHKKIENIVQLSSNIINFMSHQIVKYDLLIAELYSSNPDYAIRTWFLPRLLTGNYLVFNPAEMKKWWQDGLEYARYLDTVQKTNSPSGPLNTTKK